MVKKITFADSPVEYSRLDNAHIVLVPVPYDGTSTWLKGADKGPKAIFEASHNLEFYDIETDSEIYKKGIFIDKEITENSSPEAMVNAVHSTVSKHIKNKKFVVLLGGEHSVSIGAIKAHAENYKDMTVLQLDAHSDLRNEHCGSKYNHGCVMARVKEYCPIVQVGIRSMCVEENKIIDKKRVFYAHDICQSNSKDWVDKVIKLLTGNIYITLDLDVFDPGIMPSTGTPEPGGLLWYDVLFLLKKVIEKKNVVGFDIVELCPSENKAPDFLATKLLYKLLSYKFVKK